jgi:DNA-damage-inducible protein D family protein
MKAEEIKELFKKFEEAAQEVEGIECWSARDLQTLLGYAQWRNFELIIQKAKVSCSSVGENIAYHFADVSKMVGYILTYTAARNFCFLNDKFKVTPLGIA